jgi:xanthine dehydrogenase YagS FAD-binding subunit
MAGGLDTFDWLKDRIKRPSVVIDLTGVAELKGIRDANGGFEIGAGTTLTEITRHAGIRERYPLLAEAAGLVASPQIRNQGTIGGNVSQDTRCHYYRAGWPCYRAGGNICYADTPTAVNREHAILEADRCVAVSPSDTAPALIALDAEMVIRNSGGERVVAARDYFIGPWLDITRMTRLEPGDLLTAIRIPATFAGKPYHFEKVRDRQVWDFPLVNIASVLSLNGSTIQDSRLVVGGVAARPLRLEEAENAIRGRARNEETAQMAAEIATQGALALRHNAYKIPLMQNLVKRAIRGVAEWTS